ncbi:hypothetical protein CBR_g40953 [Chara braunii]|uniref:Cupin type-1 domain-containing protein n=1 Tax=Chara braunii TaxID=69332 RepID=A0A388LV13_CHABU|nr:hypothetical protein CBR_g40953 [Chara braunii]|eukprot:GBG86052.1 hypothetical protein CBR_g40953 [Chara braunii]
MKLVDTMTFFLFFLLTLCVTSAVSVEAGGAPTSSQYLRHAGDLRELIKAEGGSVRSWGGALEEFPNASLGAGMVTLEAGFMMLPEYSDCHFLLYVIEGSAFVGLMSPVGIPTNARRIEQGDVFAIPRGWVSWAVNCGSSRLRVFAAWDTSEGHHRGECTHFHLAGASSTATAAAEHQKDTGSILRGFSKDLLAKAWDVDVSHVERLLRSQHGSAIVRLPSRSGTSRATCQDVVNQVADTWTKTSTISQLAMGLGDDVNGEQGPSSAFGLLPLPGGEHVYRLDRSSADVANKGGKLWLLNVHRMPALRQLGMGAYRLVLRPGAVVGPAWSVNAHHIVYIIRGKGHVQIAGPDGRNELDAEVRAGQVVAIPRFFAALKVASEEEPLEIISVTSSSMPLSSFLSGTTSLLKNMPLDVVTHAFNIDSELEEHFREKRREVTAILPQSHSSESQDLSTSFLSGSRSLL